jgi:hypothetical protein
MLPLGFAVVAATVALALPAMAGAAPRRPPSVVPPGLNETVETAHFIVHYTTAAGDPNATTAEHAGLLAQAGEQGYAVEVNHWGFPAPLDDGDGKTDIYVFGTEALARRDTGREQTTGYITYSPRAHQVHIPHEYFHLVQFGIYAGEHGWLSESTADWANVSVFANVTRRPFAFRRPDVPLDCTGPATTDCGGDRYGYHGSVFFVLLTERYGGPVLVREIFERAAVLGAGNRQAHSLQAVGDVLAAHGTSIEAAFNEYAVANETGSYSLPGLGKQRPRQASLEYTDVGRAPPLTVSVDHLAVTYIGFEPAGGTCLTAKLRLTVAAPAGVPAAPAFVKAGGGVTPVPPDTPTDIPWSTCRGSGTLVLPNPSTTVDAAAFRIQANVSAPRAPLPRVKLTVAKRVPLGRTLRFRVQSSGGGEFRAVLRSRTVGTAGFLHRGTNRLALRLPRTFKAGRHTLTVTPYSATGAKGKPISRKITFTRG